MRGAGDVVQRLFDVNEDRSVSLKVLSVYTVVKSNREPRIAENPINFHTFLVRDPRRKRLKHFYSKANQKY